MKILVTGGAGYIGSHTCVELMQAGHDVVVVDNFCNSVSTALERVETIAARKLSVVDADVRDESALANLFQQHQIDAVIHFAALKAVGESVQQPLRYFENNISATLTLCKVMAQAGVFRLVFSSSATVYGDPHSVPIDESFPTSVTNPYGRTKLMCEEMLRDIAASDPRWAIVLLRYFNPVGAHESGLIGEDPNGIPNNLMPYVTQVAIGRLQELQVFGGDYPTRDGTGVRDYIHVVDLAQGHLAALNRIQSASGVFTYNLGTGKGYSVLEVVRAFEQMVGKPIPYRIVARRPGDIAECYAATDLARTELGWSASRDINTMARDAWRWQCQNPNGYRQE